MSNPSTYKRMRLVLGDQLNAKHSWFKKKCPDTLYVLIELKQELTYCRHHVQKACAFLAAMQQFASALAKVDHHVLYMDLDQTSNLGGLPEILLKLCIDYQINEFQYQQADEWRLQQQLQQCESQLLSHCPSLMRCVSVDSEHFYLSRQDCRNYFKADTSHRLGHFYKKMRKQFSVLMQGDEPEGGKWDYDVQNRKKINAKQQADIPEPLLFTTDVSAILVRLKKHNIQVIGEAENQLLWPCNRKQSLKLLDYFCQQMLPNFGHFQDAMLYSEELCNHSQAWGLYHARLSFSLNSKMLSPREVVDKVITHYQQHSDDITLPQVEGFVRQILGWREFVRGMYWANMPAFKQGNFLEAKRSMPQWFWTGQTKMRCMQQSITQSLKFAYAHHIQRLMITGNFCLLAGVDPD